MSEDEMIRCRGCGGLNSSAYRFCMYCGAVLRHSGVYVCPTCEGTGTVICNHCSGTGKVGNDSCPVCGGSGKRMCHTCSGRGRIGDFEFEVQGTNAEDVERVTKTLLERGLKNMPSNSKVEIHLHNSTLGILNTGEIENVHSISVNVSTLSDIGFSEIADALKNLTEAIANSQEIASTQRAELLEQVEELSKQATLKPNERTKAGVIKALLSSLATALGAAGGLAEVWNTWGRIVTKFFGL